MRNSPKKVGDLRKRVYFCIIICNIQFILMNSFTKRIAKLLGLSEQGVDNTLTLLDEGCTIPFISRYRKERTGGLNEVQIMQIADMNLHMKELEKRKETILKTITEQGKLTDELQRRINECWDATELEDEYFDLDGF